MTGSPYRGLSVFGEQDAALFFGREAAAARGAGPDVAAAGGHGPAGGVGGVGRGQVVAAAGGGAAADPGGAGWRPRRERRRGRAWCSPRPGRRWMSWRCGWRRWPGRTRPRCGEGWTPDPDGFALTARQAALARPPGPAGDGGWPGGYGGHPAAAAVAAGGRPVRGAVHPVRRGGAAAGVHHRAARGRHRPARRGSAPAALVVLGVRADFEARCADYPQLADAVQDRYLVTAMTERQLRMAITEPAKKAGLQRR